MKKSVIFFCFITSLLLTTPTNAHNEKRLIVGSVQFPKTIEKLEDICIYYGGKKIGTEVDQEGKRVSFSLSENKYRSFFYLLIIDCRAMGLERTENNTIKHLKRLPDWPYKFYVLELIDEGEQKNEKKAFWRIKAAQLPEHGRIPDETIIVCCDPDFIEKVSGGSGLELPKIYIKKNILSLVGSDTQLHDQAIKALLSSIDYNALHSSIKHTVRQDLALKTIIIAPEI